MKARSLSIVILSALAVHASASFISYMYHGEPYSVSTISGPSDSIFPGPSWLGGSVHSFNHFCQASDPHGGGSVYADGFVTSALVGMQVSCSLTGRAAVSGGSKYLFFVTETTQATLNLYGQFTPVGTGDLNFIQFQDVTTGATIWTHNTFAGQNSVTVNLEPGHVYNLFVKGARDNRSEGDPTNSNNFVAADVMLPGAVVGFGELLQTSISRDLVPVAIEFWQNGEVKETVLTGMTSGGRFSANTWVRGQVDVVIKPSNFLSERETVTLTNGSVFLPYLSFINGDINNDNEIGPADFTMLSAAFGSMVGDSNYTAAADLNDDEEVGPADFTILGANFGLMGE